MTTQLELAVRTPSPEISAEDVDRVCAALAHADDWIEAAALAEQLGTTDRKVRKAAEYSDGRILSGPGCPGYKLLDSSARLGDADRAASCLESQARRMLLRAARIRARMHRFAAGKSPSEALAKEGTA